MTPKTSQFMMEILLPRQYRNQEGKPSDDEAGALYSMWKRSPRGTGVFCTKGEDERRYLSAWRVKGLVSGMSDNLTLTDKGRKLIVEMATNEPNAFDKSAKEKPYSEVVRANKKKRNSTKLAFNLKREKTTKNGSSDK